LNQIIAIWLAVISVAPTADLADSVSFAISASHMAHAGIDSFDLVTLATIETGETFKRDQISRSGACGVLQVMPKWSPFECKEMADPLLGVVAGSIAWVYWVNRKGLKMAPAHYNAGGRPNLRKGSRTREYLSEYRYIRSFLEGARKHPEKDIFRTFQPYRKGMTLKLLQKTKGNGS
jgi:hypothetical protein